MASMVKEGNKAPAFTLTDKDGQKISLKNYIGKWIVLYFYPKDNTSGCTSEAKDFTDTMPVFKKKGAVIIGISPDSEKSHANFVKKHDLKITLLSDSDHKVLEKYGVWQLKKMYGREYMGVVRSTFLIDPKGENVKDFFLEELPNIVLAGLVHIVDAGLGVFTHIILMAEPVGAGSKCYMDREPYCCVGSDCGPTFQQDDGQDILSHDPIFDNPLLPTNKCIDPNPNQSVDPNIGNGADSPPGTRSR